MKQTADATADTDRRNHRRTIRSDTQTQLLKQMTHLMPQVHQSARHTRSSCQYSHTTGHTASLSRV